VGIEYTLRFPKPDGVAVADALRPLPFVRSMPEAEEFELRAQAAASMPDAVMRIESYGLYFCDNGGRGREMLGVIVARLVSRFGPVTIAELE
jgi:hypothetical protein